jgi:hypothetical protein
MEESRKLQAGGYIQPFYLLRVGAPLFSCGRLLEHGDGPDGAVTTFAILPTAANMDLVWVDDTSGGQTVAQKKTKHPTFRRGSPATKTERPKSFPGRRIQLT